MVKTRKQKSKKIKGGNWAELLNRLGQAPFQVTANAIENVNSGLNVTKTGINTASDVTAASGKAAVNGLEFIGTFLDETAVPTAELTSQSLTSANELLKYTTATVNETNGIRTQSMLSAEAATEVLAKTLKILGIDGIIPITKEATSMITNVVGFFFKLVGLPFAIANKKLDNLLKSLEEKSVELNAKLSETPDNKLQIEDELKKIEEQKLLAEQAKELTKTLDKVQTIVDVAVDANLSERTSDLSTEPNTENVIDNISSKTLDKINQIAEQRKALETKIGGGVNIKQMRKYLNNLYYKIQNGKHKRNKITRKRK